MKVSIITVTYNSAETLRETLRSIASQDYQNLELILVDGGSTDNTLAIAEEFKSIITKQISEKDKGLYDALNKGLTMATGDVVGILHSDDFYLNPQIISKYVRCFDQTQADAVYADLYYVDRSNTKRIVRKWKSGTYHSRSFYRGWMPPHPTFFVKRRVYEDYGDFDLKFKTAADYELMLRFILKHQITLGYLAEYTVKMRMGGASNASLGNRLNANKEDRSAWKKNGLRPGLLTLYLKPLRKLLQFL